MLHPGHGPTQGKQLDGESRFLGARPGKLIDFASLSMRKDAACPTSPCQGCSIDAHSAGTLSFPGLE